MSDSTIPESESAKLLEAVQAAGARVAAASAPRERIIPKHDHVLLEVVEEKRSSGGIIIPDKARGNQRDAQLGKVIAVGTYRITEFGVRLDVDVEVGDTVLIARGAGIEVESERRKYRLIRCGELLGKVEHSSIIAANAVLP